MAEIRLGSVGADGAGIRQGLGYGAGFTAVKNCCIFESIL